MREGDHGEGVVGVLAVADRPGGGRPVEEGLEEGGGFGMGQGPRGEDACGGVEGVEG